MSDNFNTAYDDVCRTLLIDCSQLIIPVVNEIFGEHYTGQEKIVLSPNEIFLKQQDGSEIERITDSSFDIVTIGEEHARQYHLECQSTTDGSMLIRMYEYDSQLALKNGVLENGVLNVNFPQSAIIYLRANRNTPDIMRICINTPDGSISYRIPALKVKNYDIDTIFEKNLLFLIPFHIFVYEKQLVEISKDEEKLLHLKKIYADIVNRLEQLCEAGKLDEYTKVTICEMSKRVINKLAKKYKNIRREVTNIMGGKVLEHEAKRIYQSGEKSGKAESILELLEEKGNISEDLRNTIYAETSYDILKSWLKAASKAENIEEFMESM